MDWYIDSSDHEALSELRHEFGDYLRRHADADGDIAGSQLVFAELVNNAAEHAGGPIWISVDWGREHPVLTVWDLGDAFDASSITMPDRADERGRGLAIASALAADLELAARHGGGTRTQAELKVSRPPQASADPPRRTIDVLPDMEEAGPDGFGKESFLRALVVQLAQELERRHGPVAAEEAVAQVGTNVGGQMEREYRTAANVAGSLSSQQLADCYVRLKHAIDGGFFVIEASQERIVLGNTRCPFGEAVIKSPALCRMTSSVFGGIAARNTGEATVVLEERIAVGDPGCRVVVNLGTGEMPPHGHRYLAPVEA